MSGPIVPDDPYTRAAVSAQDLVRDLNNVREAAVGIDPAYRWNGAPTGVRLDELTIHNAPPSWFLCATSNFEPADDARLWQVLSKFAASWASREGEEELNNLALLAIHVRSLKVGQLVRIGPRRTGSMLDALVNAACEISRTVNLCSPPNVSHLRRLVSEQLLYFDACEAYDAIHGEIDAAKRNRTSAGQDATADTARTASAFCFSTDYRSLRWGTEMYTFSEKQAAVCRALWEARQQGTPALAGVTLLDAAESSMAENARPKLSSLFKNHPAWNRVIVSAGKGLHKLAEPPIH